MNSITLLSLPPSVKNTNSIKFKFAMKKTLLGITLISINRATIIGIRLRHLVTSKQGEYEVVYKSKR
jgi:hypothetical protein